MIIAYIYNRLGNTIIGQVQKILGFSCNIKLNDNSTADLIIANEDIIGMTDILKQNNRISVYYQEGTQEKLLIEGYIRGFEASFIQTTIKIEDKLSILDDKLIYADISYNGTIKGLLENIITNVNIRENTGITVDCNILDIFQKDFGKGEVVGNIIKDIRQNKFEYRIVNNVLIFRETVGIDRSISGDDFTEFTRDYVNPTSRTIRDAKVVGDIKQMANCTIGKNGATIEEAEDAESIADFGRVERPFTSNGSVTESSAGFIEERKNNSREYDILPISNDFRACDIGDYVKVYINNGNDFMYYNGAMKVVEKSFKSGEVNTVGLKVAKGKLKSKNLSDELKEMKTRISKIEYNQ